MTMQQSLLSEILRSYAGKRNELIPILQEIQSNFGYLSEEAMREVARFLRIPESEVYSVASFYAQFRLTPLGRKRVAVCRGTACHVRGASLILNEVKKAIGTEEGETTEDLEYTLETVACIGCCALAPCIRINEDIHGEMTPEKAKELFSAMEREKQAQLQGEQND